MSGTAAFFIAHLVSSVIYYADGNKEKGDLQEKEPRDSSKKKSSGHCEIELIDANGRVL